MNKRNWYLQGIILSTLCLSSAGILNAQENCIQDLTARSKSGKIQLTWTPAPGVEGIDVLRSNEAAASDFIPIAAVDSQLGSFLDFPPANGVTYLYQLVDGDTCVSEVIAARPAQRGSRGVNNDPVIFTDAVESATQGRAFIYDVGAADPDSDAIEYALTVAPQGMSIDVQTGLIQWLPVSPGVLPADILVVDGRGGTDTQSLNIDVTAIDLGGTTAVIGPGGGTVAEPAGVTVTVPPGALLQDSLIGAEALMEIDRLPNQFPSSITQFVGGASLGPDGTQFEIPVTVTVPLTVPFPPGTRLPVLVYDEQRGSWEDEIAPATVNADGVSADYQTPHFSVFVVYFSELDSEPLFGNIDAWDSAAGLMEQVRTRFFGLFALGGLSLQDPGDSPNPDQLFLDFFNCYQAVGASFIVDLIERGGAAVARAPK